MQLTSRKRKTVLYLHGSSHLYGADKTILQLVRGLDPKRFRAVVALPKDGPLVPELEEAGAQVEIGPLGVGCRASMTALGAIKLAVDTPRAIKFVRRVTAKYQPDIIHTNTLVVLGGAIGAWTTKTPHVWHVHEIMPERSKLTRFFSKALSALSHVAVSNSHSTRESLGCKDGHEHEVILNGIDSEVASPSDRCHRPRILMVGRINSWKGQELLIDAAKSLRATHPEARYRIVGDAPPGQPHFEEALHKRIEDAQLQDVVTCVGFTKDTASEFLAADIVVVPSTLPEPFGLVAVEAMAQGTPVVAANHGGLREVVVQNETGLLFRPGDAQDLADKLNSLLNDPELAKRLGEAGRERQASLFSSERYCADFAHLYERMAAA